MKLLIFDNRAKAILFANRVHVFLSENRPRYAENTERWSHPNKSDNAQRWMVKIPYDAKRWTKKFIERQDEDGFIRIANRLPDNWRNVTSIN